MFANPSYSVFIGFEPCSTLYYKLSTNAMSSDSTIFCPIFCRSARLSHSFHRFLKLRIGFRRQKEKVLYLLIGQLHLNVRRNADICKAFAFGCKVFLNRQIDRRAVAQLVGALSASLAGGVRADERGTAVLLQSRREELRRRMLWSSMRTAIGRSMQSASEV